MIDEFFTLIGKAVGYGLLPAGAAFIVFRVMGESWLKSRLDTRLESVRHANSEALEQLRYDIRRALDSTTRLTAKEYEVLPRAWRLLHRALAMVRLVVSHARQYPDLNTLTKPELEEFLSSTGLSETRKERIRASAKPTDEYIKIIFWVQLNDTRNACRKFHTYVRNNSIFLGPELKVAFEKLDEIMWSATTDREMSEQLRGTTGSGKTLNYWAKAYDTVKNNAEPVVAEIEGMVQARLRRELRRAETN